MASAAEFQSRQATELHDLPTGAGKFFYSETKGQYSAGEDEAHYIAGTISVPNVRAFVMWWCQQGDRYVDGDGKRMDNDADVLEYFLQHQLPALDGTVEHLDIDCSADNFSDNKRCLDDGDGDDTDTNHNQNDNKEQRSVIRMNPNYVHPYCNGRANRDLGILRECERAPALGCIGSIYVYEANTASVLINGCSPFLHRGYVSQCDGDD